MKKYLLLFPLLFLLQFNVLSQRSIKKVKKKELKEFSDLYTFDESQKRTFNNLLDRKFNQLEEIETFRNSNPSLYRQKRRAIFEGMEASLRRTLNEEQQLVYEREQKKKRLIIANKTKNLDGSAESKERIKDLNSGVRDY